MLHLRCDISFPKKVKHVNWEIECKICNKYKRENVEFNNEKIIEVKIIKHAECWIGKNVEHIECSKCNKNKCRM